MSPSPGLGPPLRPADLWRPDPSVATVLAAAASPGAGGGTGAPRRIDYGYGKVAFRDALDAVGAGPGTNVLLPAYLPDGVVEPVREAGAEPRFYDLASGGGPGGTDLTPDEGAVADLAGDDTAVVLAVDYFGFPQALSGLRAVCDRRGAALVEDNAHAALSRAGEDGPLLGTRTELGFTSLRKALPVPNGAALFAGAEYADREFPRAGVADGFTGADARFLAGRLLAGARSRPAAGRAVDALIGLARGGHADDGGHADGGGGDTDDGGRPHSNAGRDPAAIYERAKVPMSALTRTLCARLDAGAVVAARRRNYRAWADALADAPGLAVPFPSLPAGVCPWVFPAVVEAEGALDRAFAGDYRPGTWPPLPREVRESDAFSTATRLVDRLVRCPVHPGVDPGTVRALVDG